MTVRAAYRRAKNAFAFAGSVTLTLRRCQSEFVKYVRATG